MTNYSVLKEGRIFLGSHEVGQQALTDETIDQVIDLRVNGLQDAPNKYRHLPIGEGEQTIVSLKHNAQTIKAAYEAGETIYMHCGGGNGRACVMASALLIELGEADTVDEAIDQVQQIRPTANVRPEMASILRQMYEK